MNEHLKYVFVFFLLLTADLFSQNLTPKQSSAAGPAANQTQFIKNGDIFGTRVFVENRGQYDSKAITEDKIYFVLDHSTEVIYFTNKGLIYEMVKSFPASEEQMEAIEHGKKVKLKEPEIHHVFMNWMGARLPDIKIEASQKQSHHITYGGQEYNSSTFKKITYKNVYNNIDIEYTIPEDKAHGIKYNVILHAGADAGDIKILYSGDVKKIKQNRQGEIIIETPLDDIIEHVPGSFYTDNEAVASGFQLNNDTIGFVFPSGYQKNKTLIIDPWVTTITTLVSNNYAYDVDYDFGGNTFIYGSRLQPKVAAYNAGGVLQWTFSGSIVSPAWIGQPSGYIGNFVVDKFSSKTFICQGANFTGSGTRVIRLDANGNYDNFMTAINSLFQESWEMGFHCTSGEIFVLGGGHTSNLSAATINTTMATLVISTFQPTNTAFVHDIASHAIDDQGNIFVYYSATNAQLVNKICRVNSTFNGNNWTLPSGFSVLSEAGNKNFYLGGSVGASNGFNCLAVNANFFYYYDGLNLAAYSKSTGTQVAATTTGLLGKRQGGIAVDDCNNIYVGGNGSILTYSFNGTSFSTLTPIALTATTANQYVYDIRLNKGTKVLYVCGSGFVATYSAGISYTCPVMPGICLFNQAGVAASTSSITCATLGSATVTPNGGIGPYSFTWVPSGQTGSVATGLSPGTYTIVVFDAGFNATYTTTTTFLSPVPLTGFVSQGGLACYGASNATAAVVSLAGGSGNQSYLWTNGINTQTTPIATGLIAGNYSLTVTDGLTGCVLNPTFVISQPPQLNLFLVASSPTACVGKGITINGLSTGGTPGYTYSWTAGPAVSTYSVSQALGGTYVYTLNSKDLYNCWVSNTISVVFISNPVLSVGNVYICPLQTGTLTVAGATSYTWGMPPNGGTTGNTYTDNPAGNTQYFVLGSAQGCTSTAGASIIIKPLPVPVFGSNSARCNGQSLNFGVNTAAAYLWTGPLSFTSNLQNPVINPAIPANSGVYNVTVTGVNSCTASVSGTVTVNPTPTLSATGATVCVNQALNLSVSSFPGAAYAWTGPNAFVSSGQNPSIVNPAVGASGAYTVKVTSAVGCTNSAVADVTVTALPLINFSSNSPKCVGDVLSFVATGGVNYSWSGPNAFSSVLQNPSLVNVTLPANGVYTLTITTGPCAISASSVVIINPLPTPVAQSTGPFCEGKTVQLSVNNTGNISYVWTGPAAFTSNIQNPLLTNCNFSASGVYSVYVTNIYNCQAGSNVMVNIIPNPTLTTGNALVCIHNPATLTVTGAVTYTWSGPNSYSSNYQNALITSAGSSLTTVYNVVGRAANGCTAVASASVNTRALPIPTIIVEPGNRLCLNKTITLKGFGGMFFDWTGPDNLLFSGQTVTFVAGSIIYGGNYTLKVTDVNLCSANTNTFITVDDLPSGSLTGDTMHACVPFCSGFKFYSASNTASLITAHWMLQPPMGSQGPEPAVKFSGKTFSYCFNSPGDFIITGLFKDTLHGCENKFDFLVEAYPVPEADFKFTPLKPIENTEEVIFTNTSKGEEINNWKWFFMSNEHKSSGQNASYFFRDAGSYAVAMVAQNTWGCMDTVVKSIMVEQDFTIYVPDAFTPNGDGINDVFLPIGRGVKNYRLSIFDRWGKQIFESDDINRGWDGSLGEEPCAIGVYVWKISVSGMIGDKKELKEMNGHVTLHL